MQVELQRPPPVRFFCLRYLRLRTAPVSVKRGVCDECERPVIGYMSLPPMPVVMLPSYLYADKEALPSPSGHIFYHSRTKDVHDALPKVEGFWPSELAAVAWMVPKLLRSIA